MLYILLCCVPTLSLMFPVTLKPRKFESFNQGNGPFSSGHLSMASYLLWAFVSIVVVLQEQEKPTFSPVLDHIFTMHISTTCFGGQDTSAGSSAPVNISWTTNTKVILTMRSWLQWKQLLWRRQLPWSQATSRHYQTLSFVIVWHERPQLAENDKQKLFSQFSVHLSKI